MFDEKTRQIFEYHNGERMVKGDPLTIQRKMLSAAKRDGNELQDILKIIDDYEASHAPEPPNDQPKAGTPKTKKKVEKDVERVMSLNYMDNVDLLLGYIRAAFNIKPLEEDGLTDGEAMEMFGEFLVYMGNLKKNTDPQANSSPSTDSPRWDKPAELPMNVS